MDHEQTRQVIEKYLTTMVERGDYGSYFSDDVELTVVGTDQGAHGRAEVEGLIHAMHTQAFDAKPELRSLVVGAGMAVIEAVFAGTHQGDFAGLAATGRQVRVPYSVVYDLDTGKIKALRIYGLAQGIVEQLTSDS